ncbi:hypothetical protein [Microbispora triticiradicis]|uniref:Secreted protein n=2 Tax=Microbispora TaxID=2005 RepID=A0ABY3M4L4_9ACTN|nr:MULTISPECIES: hypothetical protein [Microbispora]TLP57031.1 hypothetical protein FED44_21710 [Microbispora fusca]TYB66987.1 hypothetical protein FXF59_04150 [Microbispora tritici]
MSTIFRPVRFRPTSRSLVPVGATLVAAVTGALLTASPAQAADGAGMSASWNYYRSDAFQVGATLPGVKLTAFGSDQSGSRNLHGTIEHVADDGRCSRVVIRAINVSSDLVNETTCGNGTYKTFSTGSGSFDDGLLVLVYRTIPGTTNADKSLFVAIPSSATDAGVRTTGTGASWSYYTATDYTYSLVRPGVRLTGYGSDDGGRSTLNTLEKTATGSGCASANVKVGDVNTSGSTCTGTAAYFSRWNLDGGLTAKACYKPTSAAEACLSTYLPKPV